MEHAGQDMWVGERVCLLSIQEALGLVPSTSEVRQSEGRIFSSPYPCYCFYLLPNHSPPLISTVRTLSFPLDTSYEGLQITKYGGTHL